MFSMYVAGMGSDLLFRVVVIGAGILTIVLAIALAVMR
jgi:hypothetical protein